MIVFGIHETRRAGAERGRGTGREVVGLELPVLPVEERAAVGRDAECRALRELVFEHQRARAGGRVDAVEVGGGRLVVGEVRPCIAPHGPAAVHRDFDVAHRRVAERHVPRAGDVEGLAVGEVAIALGADHLCRLDVAVGRPPDIHVGRRVAALPADRVGSRRLRHRAEEDAGAVLAPGERRAVADHPAAGEPGGRRIECNRRQRRVVERPAHVRHDEQHVLALAHLRHRGPLEHGHAGAGVVPGQPAVDARIVVECPRTAAGEVGDEQAVAVAHRGIDGVGQQITGAVEGRIGDAPDELAPSGGQIVHDRVGAMAGRFCPTAPAAREPAASSPATASRRTVAHEHEPRVLGERRRLHVVPHRGLARGKFPEFDPVPGGVTAAGAPDAPGSTGRPRCGGAAVPAPRPPRPPRGGCESTSYASQRPSGEKTPLEAFGIAMSCRVSRFRTCSSGFASRAATLVNR